MVIKDKEYELHFTIGRVKLIERALNGESISHAILGNDGLMSITAVETLFQYGLREAGADTWMPSNTSRELCEAYMEEAGYAAAVKEIQVAARKDLGFLFRLG